jgi:Mg2+-importing ATPase
MNIENAHPATTSERSFWSRPAEELLAELGSSRSGLNPGIARQRLAEHGPNRIAEDEATGTWRLLVKQFVNPLVIILVIGAAISLILYDVFDAAIILTIVTLSGFLGFLQEHRASVAVAELRSRLALSCRVIRGGKEQTIAASDLVPGDIMLLSAGNLVPADGVVLAANDFLVNEASLTGESLPVEKRPGIVPTEAPLAARTSAVFAGSSVRSGLATVLTVATGQATEFGHIAIRLRQRETETDFSRGVRRFGGMLLRVMFLIVLFVVVVNQLQGRPIAQSLLFAVALAVGLSPELLPAIVTVTLSAGARHLSRGGVIVRRLESIENLGSMDVLCTDKTGTITTGEIAVADATDIDGKSSDDVRWTGFLNAALETGIVNPMDAALVEMGRKAGLSAENVRKIDEIPYDFRRRRLTIVIEDPDDSSQHRLITKGAFANVIGVCTHVRRNEAAQPLENAERARLEALFKQKGESGFRVLALAERRMPAQADYAVVDERGLTLIGFLLFLDPPKETAAAAIKALAELGIGVKIISGDNRYVTAHIADAVGLDPAAMVTGEELAAIRDEALWHVADRTDLFVEIDPQQKERIVRALQHRGHAVGYLGDGINDTPALRAADVGISVDDAVDVARESADIVLLQPDLGILCRGVEDGRRTFANTLKYISITTSANFGNMISMALASPLLPFLPLLPKQILLNNFLSDFPSAAISSDNVDPEHIASPQRWDVGQIQRFMIVFGLISSCFDLLTFGALLLLFRATEAVFQTGWFVVSLLTEIAVVLVLRTSRLAIRSRPSRLLLGGTITVFAVSLVIPYAGPPARLFGFVPLPAPLLAALVAIVLAYIGATEAMKLLFYRQLRRRHAGKAAKDRRSRRQRHIPG